MISTVPIIGLDEVTKGIPDDEFEAEVNKTRAGETNVTLKKKLPIGVKEVLILTGAVALAMGVGFWQTKDW